jgi:hypothetical protein
MNKELKTILDEMCSRVGAKDINFEESEWYLKHTWTKEEQEDFRNWLSDFLYNNSKARKVFSIPKSKKYCNKASGMFILSYGWRTKENII